MDEASLKKPDNDANYDTFQKMLNELIENLRTSKKENDDLKNRLQESRDECDKLRKEKVYRGVVYDKDSALETRGDTSVDTNTSRALVSPSVACNQQQNDTKESCCDTHVDKREDKVLAVLQENSEVSSMVDEKKKSENGGTNTDSPTDPDLKSNEEPIGEIQRLNKALEDESKKFEDLSQDYELLLKRFSELSCSKMVSGNANVVELSRYRPEKLAQRFENGLYNSFFVEAIFALTEKSNGMNDDIATEYLFCLLKEVYFICHGTLSSQRNSLWRHVKSIQGDILYPTLYSTAFMDQDSSIPKDIPLPSYVQLNGPLYERLATTITKDWMNPPKETFDYLYKIAVDTLQRGNRLDSRGREKVMSYLKESVEVVWLLLTRDPQLQLVFCPLPSRGQCELFTIRDKKTHNADNYTLKVIWPALCQKDGTVLIRGEAQRISYDYKKYGTDID